MEHNPVEDLKLLHCDLIMAAGMINTVIEAAMGGECTPADIGNSLAILKEYMDRRLDLLEDENRKLRGLSALYEDTISDKAIKGIYEEYIGSLVEGGRIKEVETYYDRASRIIDLLPEDQQEPAWRSIREAGAASREQGFLEGFRKACSVFKNMDMEVEQIGKTVPYA